MGDLNGRGARESWCLCAGGGDPGDHESAPSPAADRKTVPSLCETFNSTLCVCVYIFSELEKGVFQAAAVCERVSELLSLSCPPRLPRSAGVRVLFRGSSGL